MLKQINKLLKGSHSFFLNPAPERLWRLETMFIFYPISTIYH